MKNILVLNFFPAFVPPKSGGELRYYNIYKYLSRHYDIVLLSPTYSHHKEEEIQHNSNFKEYRIPKDELHTSLHMKIDEEKISSEFSALVCALSAMHPGRYQEKYLDLYPSADIIIHEFPYMLEYDLFFGFDDKFRIYNSHNYETLLVKQIWRGPNAQKYIDLIYQLEKRLVTKSDLVFATSKQERNAFIQDFNVNIEKVKLAPNGINPQEFKFERRPAKKKQLNAIFIGSAHYPNIEAASFIINELSPRCPHIDFYIAGSCCDTFKIDNKKNIHLLGLIDMKQKSELMRGADMALNPMFSGAGTNLKTIEFLSSRIPLISTTVGVRGLDLHDGEHFILAEREHFAEKLNYISNSTEKLKEISLRGQKYVNRNYSWRKITDNIHNEIENQISKGNKKKKVILILNDFEVSDPYSGGEIRINKLYTCLSEYYRIILFCLNNDKIIKHTEITKDFLQISIPKTSEHLIKTTQMNSKFHVSANDIITSEMCKQNELLIKAVECIGSTVNSVTFSHPYLAPLCDLLPNKNIVYESHNCEVQLKKNMLKGHPDYKALINQIERIEKQIINRSSFIISVSDDDHESLLEQTSDSKEIVTIQNGVEIKENNTQFNYKSVKEIFKGHPVIIFIGSSHLPNIEALNFIVADLAPKLSFCYFIVIGTVCDAIAGNLPANVILFGKLEEKYKDILLRLADVAINPMLTGSGSNLKLAEYFANNVPVVTTPIGARGYSIKNLEDAIICETGKFSENILALINNKNLSDSLVENAFLYVKNNIDWHVLAKCYHSILNKRFFSCAKKRLLVITYRFTIPPLGGAETYLLNIVEELEKLGDFVIDIVTIDIKDVIERFHFSTDFTTCSDSIPFSENENINVLKFAVKNLSQKEKYHNSAKLCRLWMKEFHDISLKFIEYYSDPILLGGWQYPEKINNSFEIWSSEKAAVFVDKVSFIKIRASSPQKRMLRIFGDDHLIMENEVEGQFEIKLPLYRIKVLKLEIDPILLKNIDHRALGIRVSRITYRQLSKNTEKELPLDYHYRDFLKANYLDPYIDAMIRTAEKRDPAVDDIFQLTRGPLSDDLENWLDKYLFRYDVILGHSIPFRTSVLATDYGKKHGKPVVLLPHFHFDDEFYHWNSYYKALQQADCVFASPKISIPAFFSKINAKSQYVPGGISVHEFDGADSDSTTFKRIYPSSLPFVLVLGRKSGSKNYRWVIDAVRELNLQEVACNLVLIGRDEDNVPIDEPNTFYLGEQPRDVVLGALKECCCLVSMSESESFGIVLIEAWMFKKPVIINQNCKAFLDLVSDGKNGIVTDRKALPKAIKKAICQREEMERLGKNGFNKASKEYAWANIAKKINHVFLELIG